MRTSAVNAKNLVELFALFAENVEALSSDVPTLLTSLIAVISTSVPAEGVWYGEDPLVVVELGFTNPGHCCGDGKKNVVDYDEVGRLFVP